MASLEGKPANLVFHPSDRDRTWLRLFDEAEGNDRRRLRLRARSPPRRWRRRTRCDAKFTTTAMARELKTWARFGPPLGRTWEPTAPRAASQPGIRPLVGNDWTVLTAEPPPSPRQSTPTAESIWRRCFEAGQRRRTPRRQ